MIPIMQGGLMRCCLATLYDYMEEGGEESEGTKLKCRYCGNPMVAKNVFGVDRDTGEKSTCVSWIWDINKDK